MCTQVVQSNCLFPFHKVIKINPSCTGHDSSTACPDNCPQVSLDEFLQENGPDVDPGAATYLSSVEQLTNSYVTNIIRSPSQSLCAGDYHFILSFEQDGSVLMEGLVWPNCFKDHNLIQVDRSVSEEKVREIRSETLEKVNKCISASANTRVLKSQFNLNDSEAEALSMLVQTHQVHFCESEDCERCRYPPLPSLECIYRELPTELENIPVSKRFVKVMKKLLGSLSHAEVESTLTLEWLRNVWDQHVDLSEPAGQNLWKIILDSQDFYFKIDDPLVKIVEKYEDDSFAALYQYCIGVGDGERTDDLIVKRLHLLDSFTALYSPFLMKAANSRVKIELMTSVEDFQEWNFDNPDTSSCNAVALSSHIKVPLAEAFSFVDNQKLSVKASCPTEFVHVGSDSSLLLKKVKQETENSFKVEGENGFYEIQQTMVTRYFQRMNGNDILLAELACYYEYAGKEKSEKHYEVFSDKLDKIPNSELKSVLKDGNLPEFVICCNKDVLMIRKKPKVLMYQTFDKESVDFKFSQVILFSAERNFESLTPEYVDEAFRKVNDATGESQLVQNKR